LIGVRLAHDVLSDDARRSRYDATGEFAESEADNSRANALETISQAMDVVLGDLLKAGTEPTQVDFVASVKLKLQQRLREADARLGEINTCRAKWAAILPRCAARNGGDSVFAGLIVAKLSNLDLMKDRLARDRKTAEVALEIIADQTFRYDQVTFPTVATSATTTFWVRF
jgi:hypothetical protein